MQVPVDKLFICNRQFCLADLNLIRKTNRRPDDNPLPSGPSGLTKYVRSKPPNAYLAVWSLI